MNWNREDSTPERNYILTDSISLLCIAFLMEPPVKTEPYNPPDEDIPPSPYIPLALRK